MGYLINLTIVCFYFSFFVITFNYFDYYQTFVK